MYTLAILSEEVHQPDVTWLLWVALGFFAVIVVVGWLASRRQKPEAEAPAHHEHHGPHEEDDLALLEGIGPRVKNILAEAGITTFAALAEAGVDKVTAILDAAGLQMLDPEGWIEQAKLAATGDMEGLKKLQEELKSGRRAS